MVTAAAVARQAALKTIPAARCWFIIGSPANGQGDAAVPKREHRQITTIHKNSTPAALRKRAQERRNKTACSKPASHAASLVWRQTDKQRRADRAYQRALDLPRLLPLMPGELADYSAAGTSKILAHIRKALRQERRRARQTHWAYNLQLHLGLLAAEQQEQQRLDAL